MEVKRVEREIEAAKDEKGEDWIFNTEYGEYELVKESLRMTLNLITIL